MRECVNCEYAKMGGPEIVDMEARKNARIRGSLNCDNCENYENAKMRTFENVVLGTRKNGRMCGCVSCENCEECGECEESEKSNMRKWCARNCEHGCKKESVIARMRELRRMRGMRKLRTCH